MARIAMHTQRTGPAYLKRRVAKLPSVSGSHRERRWASKWHVLQAIPIGDSQAPDADGQYWRQLARKPEAPLLVGTAVALTVAENVGAFTKAVGSSVKAASSWNRQASGVGLGAAGSTGRTQGASGAPLEQMAGSPSVATGCSMAGAGAAALPDAGDRILDGAAASTGGVHNSNRAIHASFGHAKASTGGVNASTAAVMGTMGAAPELQGKGGDTGGGNRWGGGGGGSNGRSGKDNDDAGAGGQGPLGGDIPFTWITVPWLSILVSTPAGAYVWWRVQDPAFQQWWKAAFPEAPEGVSADEYVAWDPTYLGCTAEQSYSLDEERKEKTRNRLLLLFVSGLVVMAIAMLARREQGGGTAKPVPPRPALPKEAMPHAQMASKVSA